MNRFLEAIQYLEDRESERENERKMKTREMKTRETDRQKGRPTDAKARWKRWIQSKKEREREERSKCDKQSNRERYECERDIEK